MGWFGTSVWAETLLSAHLRLLSQSSQKPVMVCEVEYLDSEEEAGPGEDEGDAVRELAQEVLTLFRNVTELNFKLRGLDSGDVARRIDFQAKARMSPREISFWVASMFSGEANYEGAGRDSS